jgi:Uma2 family endonuclease
MAATTHQLTYEEWLQLPTVEDGRDEVVKGELRFMPPTRFPRAEALRRLNAQLIKQVDENKVWIYDSTIGLMISRKPMTCRSPDLAVYSREQIVLEDGLFVSPPGLLVEVMSPSETKRHKEEKLADYASIGVPEVWLVSPEAQSIEVRMLREGKLERTDIRMDGELQPTRFPGVSVVVASIWPE